MTPFVPNPTDAVQRDFLERVSALFLRPETALDVVKGSKHFTDPLWHQPSALSFAAAMFALYREAMTQLAERADLPPKEKQTLRYLVEQTVEAASPANYWATNPVAQQRLIETQGQSLRQGIDNFLADLGRGRVSQSDESAFAVGETLAITPGDVVFRTPLFELIQYKPLTETVGSRPLLMVPPCINKFYIMDLQPHNSLVRHAVEQGNTVFLMSWRNPGPDLAHATWDQYIEDGVLEAIRVALEISGQKDLNLLGFCVGGTLVTAALGLLAARNQKPVHSLTLLTTLIDFSHVGALEVFINEQHVRTREATLGQGGILSGRELASTFSSLRPKDLIWNYVQRNYLLGTTPPAFDILFWNADATNLPGPFFAYYLRNTYLENRLATPGGMRVAGLPIDVSQIDVPVYAFGAKEDHIVPWASAWSSACLLGGPVRFVLGASGHVAGTINPVRSNKRSYWASKAATGPSRRKASSAEAWLAQAEEHPGSWWSDWATWLESHQGPMVKAPRRPGRAKRYESIASAPGDYVRTSADEAMQIQPRRSQPQ